MPNNITPRGFVFGDQAADDNVGGNKIIEGLYFTYLSRRIELDKIAFRREIILAAYNAFGKNDDNITFNRWYYNQFTSPYLSELHVEFLRDTLKFMDSGTRKYNIETWDSLLSRVEKVPAKTMDDTIELNTFGISSPGVIRTPIIITLPNFVRSFMKKKDGTAELLYTLYILFGENYQEQQKPRFEPN